MMQASSDFKTTLVVVTHNPQIAKYGNRHFVIRDGKLVTDE
jgi:ABC-type lipoprotein export system ATPase subunit